MSRFIENRFALKAFTLLELLIVIAIIGMLIALLLPAVQATRESARRMQCVHNMTQVGIAMKQFEETRGMLPRGTRNPEGPIRNVPIGDHLGWIPLLLPYMELSSLAAHIDYTRGPYAPVNQPVWVRDAPPFLLCPSQYAGDGQVNPTYMACHGGTETPIDTDNDGVFYLNSRLRSRDIEKGTSHTIFLGEGVTINSYLARGGSAPSGGAYSGLGWMSGTPGTIRNTGSPINQTFPTAVWPLPFRDGVKQIDGYPWSTNVYADSDVDTGEAASDKASDKVSGKVSGKDTGKASDKAAEKAAEAAAVQKQLDALWGTVIPEQYYVGGYGSVHPQVSNFLFGDGSARPLNQMIDPVVYSDLGRRHGVAP